MQKMRKSFVKITRLARNFTWGLNDSSEANSSDDIASFLGPSFSVAIDHSLKYTSILIKSSDWFICIKNLNCSVLWYFDHEIVNKNYLHGYLTKINCSKSRHVHSRTFMTAILWTYLLWSRYHKTLELEVRQVDFGSKLRLVHLPWKYPRLQKRSNIFSFFPHSGEVKLGIIPFSVLSVEVASEQSFTPQVKFLASL